MTELETINMLIKKVRLNIDELPVEDEKSIYAIDEILIDQIELICELALKKRGGESK